MAPKTQLEESWNGNQAQPPRSPHLIGAPGATCAIVERYRSSSWPTGLAQRAKVKRVLCTEHCGVWAYHRLPQTRESFIELGGKLHRHLAAGCSRDQQLSTAGSNLDRHAQDGHGLLERGSGGRKGLVLIAKRLGGATDSSSWDSHEPGLRYPPVRKRSDIVCALLQPQVRLVHHTTVSTMGQGTYLRTQQLLISAEIAADGRNAACKLRHV